jgi:hypothetical protein
LTKRTGKKKRVKKWRLAIAMAYAFILGVSVFNVILPSSAIPVLSFDYSPDSQTYQLTVPPGPATSIFAGVNTTMTMNTTISAPQPFANGVDITVNVQGCEKPTSNVTFSQFVVGFLGAYDAKHPNSGQGVYAGEGNNFNGEIVLAVSFLVPKPGASWGFNCPTGWVHFLGSPNDNTIFFQNPGTYPVIVRGTYWPNFTYSQYTYPSDTIIVQPSSVSNQEVYNKTQTVVLVASSAFIVLELFPEIKKRLTQ